MTVDDLIFVGFRGYVLALHRDSGESRNHQHHGHPLGLSWQSARISNGDCIVIKPTPQQIEERAAWIASQWDASKSPPKAKPKANLPAFIEQRQKERAEFKRLAQEGAQHMGITWEDGKHYAAALAHWAKAGFPVRDQKTVLHILENCCRPCEWYRNGWCKRCGCRVNGSRFPLVNKLKMATEHCRAKLWPGDTDSLPPAATEQIRNEPSGREQQQPEQHRQ